jgi:ribonucleoside-diphosphate reductase alpha chain
LKKRDSDSGKASLVDRNRIARLVFAVAQSQGISDREVVETLAGQVIARLESKPREMEKTWQPLPGMEGLVSSEKARPRPVMSDEIDDILKEILAGKETSKTSEKETEPKMESMVANHETLKSVAISNGAIELTENARQVLERRYLKKDKQGKVVETPKELFRRVAVTIAAAELLHNPKADTTVREAEFYDAMVSLKFLPNSPTLMNAGRELGQLSACFVLPVEDSMESIFDAVKYTALIHKSGGGTGFSFSRLRPAKDRVGSTGGIASGPLSFMRAFDTATDVIKQGGMRRGANMAILSVDHPDILEFIKAKSESATAFTNFNLSVAVTDAFMEAVKNGTEYRLINPRTGEESGKLDAREVFNKIVDGAWATGDPGVVFIDRINQYNPTPKLGRIESTNPCGEQPLLPYESCNLGSINLARMVKNAHGKAEIDYDELARVVRLAVRFLDNVIDVNRFPLPQIEQRTKQTRKIGLGVMGFADMLVQLGAPYNSEEGVAVAEKVMGFINREALECSQALAAERGVFPVFEGSVYDVAGGSRVRNASRTTIAPTGTLSLIAGCSSGIEPLFALSYTRNILDGTRMVEVNPYFEAAARADGFYSAELMADLASGKHLEDIEGISDEVKRRFVTAHEITPEWHVKMQAAFQKHTDNAVSKTVNFAKSATREDVANVYQMAFDAGLKGITIYRDGSREGQVLTTGNGEAEKAAKKTDAARTPRKRPRVTTGVTERVTTGCGYIYVTVNSDEKGVFEVFSTLGKSGGCASAQLESICRLISLALRAGVDATNIVRQLRGIRCPSIAWEEGKSILSCADAIASVLERHTTGYDGKPRLEDYGMAKNLAGQCPDCGSLLTYMEGCFICQGCGYTKC